VIYEYDGFIPVIHETAFIHPLASVMGNVQIGANVFIGSGAAIRGDIGKIIIEDGCNVQENCIIHMFPGKTVRLKEMAHIGHGAIVHGANVGKNTLVGMNAVLMDDAEIGDECVIGALCFVPAGKEIPNRSVGVGNPVKLVKEVSDKMLGWKTEGTLLYQKLAKDSHEGLKEVEPLRQTPKGREDQGNVFKPWNETK
jgi:carbonic anhydrase/acetyltransferase-like protein (isoleucine patch superfamily)